MSKRVEKMVRKRRPGGSRDGQKYVHPLILGRGRRLFESSDKPHQLRLAETRTFSNGVVLLHYQH